MPNAIQYQNRDDPHASRSTRTLTVRLIAIYIESWRFVRFSIWLVSLSNTRQWVKFLAAQQRLQEIVLFGFLFKFLKLWSTYCYYHKESPPVNCKALLLPAHLHDARSTKVYAKASIIEATFTQIRCTFQGGDGGAIRPQPAGVRNLFCFIDSVARGNPVTVRNTDPFGHHVLASRQAIGGWNGHLPGLA